MTKRKNFDFTYHCLNCGKEYRTNKIFPYGWICSKCIHDIKINKNNILGYFVSQYIIFFYKNVYVFELVYSFNFFLELYPEAHNIFSING